MLFVGLVDVQQDPSPLALPEFLADNLHTALDGLALKARNCFPVRVATRTQLTLEPISSASMSMTFAWIKAVMFSALTSSFRFIPIDYSESSGIAGLVDLTRAPGAQLGLELIRAEADYS